MINSNSLAFLIKPSSRNTDKKASTPITTSTMKHSASCAAKTSKHSTSRWNPKPHANAMASNQNLGKDVYLHAASSKIMSAASKSSTVDGIATTPCPKIKSETWTADFLLSCKILKNADFLRIVQV